MMWQEEVTVHLRLHLSKEELNKFFEICETSNMDVADVTSKIFKQWINEQYEKYCKCSQKGGETDGKNL